eukprot:13211170-Alexandrium_andersonii.AAC.1
MAGTHARCRKTPSLHPRCGLTLGSCARTLPLGRTSATTRASMSVCAAHARESCACMLACRSG